jgi:hypothetical protein
MVYDGQSIATLTALSSLLRRGIEIDLVGVLLVWPAKHPRGAELQARVRSLICVNAGSSVADTAQADVVVDVHLHRGEHTAP